MRNALSRRFPSPPPCFRRRNYDKSGEEEGMFTLGIGEFN